jgi:hypothetical protein
MPSAVIIMVSKKLSNLFDQTTPTDHTGIAWRSGCKKYSTSWRQCCENM